MRLLARIKDWLLSDPDHFVFDVDVTSRDILLADDNNTPLELAVTRLRGCKVAHTTRILFLRFDQTKYEAELPRLARNFVWEWERGRAVRPIKFRLECHKIKRSKGKWQPF